MPHLVRSLDREVGSLKHALKRSRKPLLLVVVLVVALLVGGCGSPKAPAPQSPNGAAPQPSVNHQLSPTVPAVSTAAVATRPPSEPTSRPNAPTPLGATSTPQPSNTQEPQPVEAEVAPETVRLTKLAWSPDGALLALGAATGVYVYDACTWQEIRFIPLQAAVPSLPAQGPEELAFSFDGSLLAILNRVVQVWRVADGTLAYELKAPGPLAASPAEGLWATFGDDGYASGDLRFWRTSDGQLVRTVPTGLMFPFSIAFSADGALIAAGPMQGGVPGVWRVADGQRVAQLRWDNADSYDWADLAFGPNSSTGAAIGGMVPEAVLLLWDTGTGAVARELVGLHQLPDGPVAHGVSFAPDGTLAASFWGAAEGQSAVQLWTAAGKRGRSWPLPRPPAGMSFSPDGKALAVAAEEQSVYLYDRNGNLIRELNPLWRHGILPTPTPTPLSAGLELPSDWKEYVNLESHSRFRLRYPPEWRIFGSGTDSVTFAAPSPDAYDSKSAMIVDLMVNMGGYLPSAPGDPATVAKLREDATEGIVSMYLWSPDGPRERNFVAEGSWPLLVAGTYVEFDTKTSVEGRGQVRVIELIAWPASRSSVMALLIDELEDLGEEDRLNLSRVLASVEFEDPKQAFPTATPTATPTPNAAARPALPLTIDVQTKVRRSNDFAVMDIVMDIKDAEGKPVNGAEVFLASGHGYPLSIGVSRDGRIESQYGSSSEEDQVVSVQVRWDQELIAEQELRISWK